MSSYGFTGFPMRDSLPRGFIFVDFMRMRRSATPVAAPAPAPSAPATRVAGGFDPNATETTLSRKHTTLNDGTVRTDAQKRFSDGSHRAEVKHRRTDGTFTIETERRSLPDADGFEKVRVWERTTAPDGTQSGTFHVFRVPTGMQVDWDAAEAQEFLLSSNTDAVAPDGTILPDIPTALTEAATDTRERNPENAAPRRPVIPLAP